jgi:tRNA pseudouridine38-40 synthase
VNGDGTTRLRLDIAYDGTAFSGWSKQPSLRTVQGVLDGALSSIFRRFGDAPTLTVAGRTDAGVHATGQVAHLDLSPEQCAHLDRPRGDKSTRRAVDDGPVATNSTATALAKRINGILGLDSDVVVAAASVAADGFDARFSAVWRSYEYRLADSSVTPNPVLRNHVVRYPARLNVDDMQAAASALLGLHDFASYCKPREGATTIRTLQEFDWGRDSSGILVARVRADAFCHSMVRALVGACVAAGAGKLGVGDVVRLRDAQQRTSEFKVMPAKGLTLVEVGYPPEAELGQRAAQTRAKREILPLTGELAID